MLIDFLFHEASEVALDSGRLDFLGREPTQLIILSERFRDSALASRFQVGAVRVGGSLKPRCREGPLLSLFPSDIVESWAVGARGGNVGNDLPYLRLFPSLQ